MTTAMRTREETKPNAQEKNPRSSKSLLGTEELFETLLVKDFVPKEF